MQPVADKNFLKFLGEPLIEWQLSQIWNAGFKEIILVGGAHNIEQLRELDDRMPMQIDVVEQENLDEGMSGAALAAAELIGDEPCLVFSSNDVVDGNAFELMKEAIGEDPNESPDDVYLLAKKVTEYFPGGYLRLENEGFVAEVVEKPEPGEEPSDLVNLVVHYFKNFGSFVEKLREAKSDKDDIYEVGLTAMIDSGAKVRPVEYDGFWQPVKFPWHVGLVFDYLFGLKVGGVENGHQEIHPDAEVSDKAVVEGAVIIDEGARVMAGATVKGPCYIGKNSIVATNALVRGSNLGENCVIGFATEVARSHLGDNVWTHSNYIGDSVIGNDVSFGAGTVTGNLRLDEGVISMNIDTSGASDASKVSTGTNKWGLVTGDHIRVGINTSFMPGRKIGSESYIGAGLVIAEDIPEKSFVRGEMKLKISENKGTFNEEMREKMRKKL